MKKGIIFTMFCFWLSFCFSQNKEIDTSAIGFKAKLFTVSEYGISDKNQILKDIENQKITFLKTKYESFIFMKIDFAQPYRLPTGSTQTLKRDCSYYIAFNVSNSIFYRLGGFDTIDVDSFFEALEVNESGIFKDIEEGKEIDGIDIYCLHDYYQMSKKKRLKKGFKCLDNCSKKTETLIITH
ncbi:hypothetical protein [Winogradskyella undariae]|uniref:hypothetical protein n=1 Tax=Winogradskyella undariae TaxID=1285465 RepID=UPI0015C852B9|nr:hypothetical protein [Winogradskyella undariae]